MRERLVAKLWVGADVAKALDLFDHLTLGRKVLDPGEPGQLHPAPNGVSAQLARVVLMHVHYPDAL